MHSYLFPGKVNVIIINIMIAIIFIVINLIILKVLDVNGTSVLLTTDLAEDKTYMKWCNYWDQVTIIVIIDIIVDFWVGPSTKLSSS